MRRESFDEGRLFPMTKHNIIVVGTSAGGVEALCAMTKHLPKDLDASILVVMGYEAASR
jgi:chemotaxis response regulator CheB